MSPFLPFRAFAALASLCWLTLPAFAYTTVEFNQLKNELRAREQANEWEQATSLAQRMVGGARANAAEQPLRLAEALTLLGDAHVEQNNFALAEPCYREALQLVENNASPGSAALVQPLMGLGAVQTGLQRNDEAVATLSRALLLARRNRGLFDVSQADALRALSNAFLHLRRFSEAAQQIDYLEKIAENAYGPDDPRMTGTLNEIGQYYSRTGRIDYARLKYQRAIQIIENKVGKNDPMLVPSLRGLADTYVNQMVLSRVSDDEPLTPPTDAFGTVDTSPKFHRTPAARDMSRAGLDGLKRALAIVEAHPGTDSNLLTATLIQIGDWYTIIGDPQHALPYYQRAWKLGATDRKDAKAEDSRETILTSPVSLYYPIPRLAARNLDLPQAAVDEKFVQVEFTVTKEGALTNEHVVDENASNTQVAEVMSSIKAARYRPKFVDGEPVDSPGISYRQVFRVKK